MRFYLLFIASIPSLCFSQYFQKKADSIRMTRGVPALVYAVFSSDKILDSGVTGVRKYRTRDRVEYQDRFDIGTNTAAFTAYIAGKLVDMGKIKWTSKLLDVFPEFKKKAFPVYKNTSLEDLLSHRNLFPRMFTREDWNHIPSSIAPNIIGKRKAFTLYMLLQKPYRPDPESQKVQFSIAGYVMAAAMLEKVYGKPYETMVAEFINKPLNMSAKFGWPVLTDSAAPLGHWSPGGTVTPEDYDTWLKINPILRPANDMNIRLGDYVKFIQENLKGIRGEKTLIKPNTINYIHFGKLDYSLGWNNGALENNNFSFHEGICVLFNSRVEIIKEKNIGIIVMCNSGDKDGRGAVLDLMRELEAYYTLN